MTKLTLLTTGTLLILATLLSHTPYEPKGDEVEAVKTMTAVDSLYDELELRDKVSFQAFEQAMAGYNAIQPKKKVLTLIDFSKPSVEARLFVMDLQERQLLYASHVSHGQKSGENTTEYFSNREGSHQSSLGFFLTEHTYQGSNGYSLILEGLEKGINDNAKKRAIVMHGADYCNPAQAREGRRLGRSWGCPAVPRVLAQPIIDAIKDGSLLYAYSEKYNNDYRQQSKYFK